MPLSNYALDSFVAQELSNLTTPTAKSVAPEFANRNTWLETFVLTTIFTHPLPQNRAALALVILRRATSAIEDYDAACASLELVVGREKSISQYFNALGKFESAIAMLDQALSFIMKALGTQLFASGDGTPYERLNLFYNVGRHGNLETLPQGHLHLVWLRNDGIHTDMVSLRFVELEDLLRQMGRIAQRISTGDA